MFFTSFPKAIDDGLKHTFGHVEDRTPDLMHAMQQCYLLRHRDRDNRRRFSMGSKWVQMDFYTAKD